MTDVRNPGPRTVPVKPPARPPPCARAFPAICTLVGPTRHYKSFDYCSWRLGRLGWCVFSVGSHRAMDAALETTEDEMAVYYMTHRAKIWASRMVFVVDLPWPTADARQAYYDSHTRDELSIFPGPVYRQSENIWPYPDIENLPAVKRCRDPLRQQRPDRMARILTAWQNDKGGATA